MAQGSARQGKTVRSRAAGRGRSGASDLVPSRRQYLDLKAQHPHAILLYRMGDFYEAFDDDARVVARDARITLTSRSFGRNGRVPMAGIPYHALNHYLARLLAHGHTIAIAEQVSEPGRGLVERAVTRVLSPGTVGEAALLPEGENRYLASICPLGDRIGLAWTDVSTGEFAVTELSGPRARDQLAEELARLNPAECLVPDDGRADDVEVAHRTRMEHWRFEPARARAELIRHLGVRSLVPFGCEDRPAAIAAAGAILAYLERTNPALLPLLTGLRTESTDGWVGLDAATRRNLELTRSLRTGGTRGSLLGVLDETRTAMGARTLRRLVGQPLRDLSELQRRQAVVAGLVARPTLRAAIISSLGGVGDLERLVGRVTQGLGTARDFLTLGGALRAVSPILASLRVSGDPALAAFADEIDPCADVLALVEAAVEDDPEDGARIRAGFSAELDAARDGAMATRRWLAGLERRERERTGIKSLKVGYNKVFGYYIEVTRPNLARVPGDYVRKQTVATGERYVTAALKEAEARILAADEEIAALERAALARLTRDVTAATGRLLATANRLALLDALLSLAVVADRGGWTRPALEDSATLEIVGGRHPVVEASLEGEAFIANDCRLGGEAPRVLVVTGPNMGGKSTYLRQVALIVLLAQIGSFVPAERARIGLVDRIFTRVGAQDDLAGGSSTFMVEMLETATILRQATERSLVILDEVGRGTGRQDGLAIAQAVLEDLHDRVRARTLFATHYLELTALAERLADVANVHLAALETDERVIFLYAVRPGPADRAYGIQVARLAGLPPWVAERAESVLAGLTEMRPAPSAGPAERDTTAPRVAEDGLPYQLRLDGFTPALSEAERLARALDSLDLTTLTPREALDWLFEQQARLRGANPSR
ncbi:DNA mismatch repair protein MutS [Sphaerobacter sp.]|uniref:DNA mismatch repair protein MutS n=1 Tax=Sphaerobacter sp. TaxID=2099654 RepID=UPI001DC63200|nr:DNA mismatch repair protein MutS [Sphaerobacter sp.]MBX5443965.1 DNA mismatch repair protein MutS [Sphaerobacter sp.]